MLLHTLDTIMRAAGDSKVTFFGLNRVTFQNPEKYIKDLDGKIQRRLAAKRERALGVPSSVCYKRYKDWEGPTVRKSLLHDKKKMASIANPGGAR